MSKSLEISSSLRVLHCPTLVGGNPQGLAAAERALGLRSRAIALAQNYLNYEIDEVLFRETDSKLQREVKLWRLIWRAVTEFDIVHYNFGCTILPARYPPSIFQSNGHSLGPAFALKAWYDRHARLADLRILERAGKGIVVTFQGDDARQGDYCLKAFPISAAQEVEPGYYSPEADEGKRWRISHWARYADRIYALNPDLLHVLPAHAEFLPYASVDPRTWQPVLPEDPGTRKPVVLHAPSHRGVKGTRFIVDAVERLQAEGVEFEFLLVESLSHAEAACLYRRADLLIDQLLVGWYGGLAVELMALGKPVICYIRQEDLHFVPARMREELPIIDATPDTIYSVLKEWLTHRRHQLTERGRRGRQFVETWHDPIKIAAGLKRDYMEIMRDKRERRTA